MPEVVAAILFIGVTAYAIFAGADFGAGFWDLLAGGAERGDRPRAVVAHSIGPVWEANHVWLIFCLVVLWTGFSEAFASITLTLFVPLSLAALGIVLRGSSFAFRKEVTLTSSRRNFGAAFAISSVIVPFCMGAVAGAIASGRVPSGGKAGDPWDSWINPTSILGGVLAVTACAFLASVYLVNDARRLDDAEMVEYFRRRAVVMAIVTGVIATIGIFILHQDSEYLFDGLTSARSRWSSVRALRCRIAPAVAPERGTGCTRAGDGCGGHRGARVGRRAVGLHPPGDAHRLRSRRARGHARDDPGGVHRRRDRDPSRHRAAVRARPEEPARARS